jgi:hypothetical protein
MKIRTYSDLRRFETVEWRQVRDHVIVRDKGCDLGVDGYEIYDRIYIHHMNPMTVDDLVEFNREILEPEYLISVTHRTHNAIHYGNEDSLLKPFVERRPGDTKLW